jgi:hypothetical protein
MPITTGTHEEIAMVNAVDDSFRILEYVVNNHNRHEHVTFTVPVATTLDDWIKAIEGNLQPLRNFVFSSVDECQDEMHLNLTFFIMSLEELCTRTVHAREKRSICFIFLLTAHDAIKASSTNGGDRVHKKGKRYLSAEFLSQVHMLSAVDRLTAMVDSLRTV